MAEAARGGLQIGKTATRIGQAAAVMWTRSALAVVRVDRGAARPTDDDLRAALRADRKALKQPPEPEGAITVSGPYAIRVDGRDLDEYVVWER